jgi:uncharacterized membrane protein YgcG
VRRQPRVGRSAAWLRGAFLTLTWALLLTLTLAPLTLAQGDRYGDREELVHIADEARLIPSGPQTSIENDLEALREETGIDIVVYIQERNNAGARRGARQEAQAVLERWEVGGEDGLGAVIFWNVNPDRSVARNGVALGSAFDSLDTLTVDDEINQVVRTNLRAQQFDTALRAGTLELQNQLRAAVEDAAPEPDATRAPQRTTQRPSGSSVARPTAGLNPEPGPDFPDPRTGLTVYDYAEVIDGRTIAELRETIEDIEERTGAEIVIYTQVKPEADSPEATERDAAALIDQWGVGRAGFDDGMAIFFNLRDPCHGQVQLYAAPGFEASYLPDAERQDIYQRDMLPALRECDFDTALLAAMERIDAAATPGNARNLQLARQIDAIAGLIVGPLLLVGLVAWAGWSWLRYGRDPVYLDDDSILMPAPPPGMTPAAAAVVIDGRAKRHALTTALVDLAARGEISFRAEEDDPTELSIDITVPDQRDARLARNRRQPLGPAEQYALEELKQLGGAIRTIDPEDVPEFAKSVSGFDDRVEELVAERGWFTESPGDAIDRWSRRAALVLIAGVAGAFFGLQLPSNGLLLVGAAAVAGAVAMFVIARTMPQRTMEGARMFAQLAAYRRTLQRTLESARTMDQVVASHALPWVDTPDQAVVWSYALGLHEEAEEVLERSLEDVRTGDASPTRTYFPLWYALGARSGARISGAGGAKAPTAGLFSSGVVPDFTAMTAALSTVGSAPSSSGGSGGFSGGGSGGGGGGAGGGF